MRRATVTWMYARIGIRLAWREGVAASGAPSASAVTIQVRFAGSGPVNATSDALAFALPFADGVTAMTVMYHRIQMVAGKASREQSILAHVLAHEIGHILQCTNQHSQTGVMKAHWNGQDYDAMGKKPLDFTQDDVDLILQGLNSMKTRTPNTK